MSAASTEGLGVGGGVMIAGCAVLSHTTACQRWCWSGGGCSEGTETFPSTLGRLSGTRDQENWEFIIYYISE